MATKEKQWWDPYETSQRRDFIYRPGSATRVCFRSPAPALFPVSGPFGSTQYSEDFTWKPICSPSADLTLSGTASETRKNNPQPSQSFLMWRLPREAAGTSQNSPSEREMCEAVSAQYVATYRWDYSNWPSGRRLVSDYSRVQPLTPTGTEMRDSYRRPIQRPELRVSHFLVHPGTNQNITNCVPRPIQAKQK